MTTIAPRLFTALALSALVWLGGIQRAEAGVNVWTTNGPYARSISALVLDPQNPATVSLQAVATGWTRPSTTVTVSFTEGWDLGVDDITYSTVP